MNASDMTPTQAEKTYRWIRPAFEMLAALQGRLEALGCDPNDRVFLEIKTARDAMQLLAKDMRSTAGRTFQGQLVRGLASGEGRSVWNRVGPARPNGRRGVQRHAGGSAGAGNSQATPLTCRSFSRPRGYNSRMQPNPYDAPQTDAPISVQLKPRPLLDRVLLVGLPFCAGASVATTFHAYLHEHYAVAVSFSVLAVAMTGLSWRRSK
jgi:hypothetical protein